MARRTLASLAALCATAAFAIAQTPALHLEYRDQQHKSSRIGSQPIRVPSNETIALTVVLEPLPPGAQQGGGERLTVRAEDQEPGDFESRPPANISFVVRTIKQQASQEVPFRVSSSGGGFDPNKRFVLVDLNIVGDSTVRHAKLRELAASVIAAGRKVNPADPDLVSLSHDPEGLDRLARAWDMSGVACIPPGTYEITAVYTAKGGGTLTSKPAHFVVFDAKNPTVANQPKRELPK